MYKISLLACVIAFVSCDKDLEDINVNPNKPLEVPTGGLFNKANKDLMTNTRGYSFRAYVVTLGSVFSSKKLY